MMGRKRIAKVGRQTTTTRLYTDSLRILKILAEIQGRTLIDYVDSLARRAAAEDGPRLMEELARMAQQPGGPQAGGK